MVLRFAIIVLAGILLATAIAPVRNAIRSELTWRHYSLSRDLGLDTIVEALGGR